jgi:hypothetical protein
VIRFGLRLATAGGRESWVRLATIAAAVALGVGMLLATVAALHAVGRQSARYGWMNTSALASSTAPSTVHPTWWLIRRDYYAGRLIGRVDVAATGADSPHPPGIPALPGPGEIYASPALATLLSSVPADQLGNRFPGHLIGTVGAAALPSPDSLVVIIGHTAAEMAHTPGALRVTHIADIAPSDCDGCVVGIRAAGFDLVLGVTIGALLFPVLIFIGAATRLSAARREQRFAAMRLVGATPRQVSVISAAETTAAAVVGTLTGFALFFAIRGPLALIPFTGDTFYRSDLTLHAVDVVCVAVGVPVLAAIAARLALRRVQISPLGVSRQSEPKVPSAWRLVVAVAGLAELAYFLRGRVPRTGVGQIAVFLPAILTVMTGLVLAGPWFTMVVARLLARQSRRPASLIAARRLADNPQAAFRAIGGLVVGLFVTTVAVGILTTIEAYDGGLRGGTAQTVMSQTFWGDRPSTAVPAGLLDKLAGTPGVRAAMVVRLNPTDKQHQFVYGGFEGLVSCADLARDPALRQCAPGAVVASVLIGFEEGLVYPPLGTVWPTIPISADVLDRLPVAAVSVDTDGSHPTLERARTVLYEAYPNAADPPATADDWAADTTRTSTGFRQLAYVVSLASLPIAGCSLAVSVAGGLSERKRPFSLLRLSGVPVRMLRRVVVLESVLPLLVVAAVAIGMGLLAAQLFLRAQMHYTLSPPGLGYYVIVTIGLAVSLAIISSTLPLLERVTGPEAARND